MGVFTRPDSSFYWLFLEGIRRKEATRIPICREGSPRTQQVARRAAHGLYLARMLAIHNERPQPTMDVDSIQRVRVALLAQINQWRFEAASLTPAEEERAQALRECAYDLEKLLDALGEVLPEHAPPRDVPPAGATPDR